MKSIVILSIFFLSVVAGERFIRQAAGFPGFQNFPFPQPTFNFPQPGAPGTQTSFISSSQTLNNRFGEDPVVTGQSTIFQSSGNKYQQTNTVLRPDGSVTTNKQSGRVRRDTPTKSSDQTPVKSDQPLNTPPQQPIQTPSPTQPSHERQPENVQFQPKQETNQHQPNYQQQPEYQQQPIYNPQQQGFPIGQFPFGIGFFGQPQLGFAQPQIPFGQPQFGFQNPYGFAPQPGFGFAPVPAAPIQPGPGVQTGFVGATQTLDNRFGEETVSGGSQIITSNNGNYHITSSVLKPDGQVVTSQQSGTINKKP